MPRALARKVAVEPTEVGTLRAEQLTPAGWTSGDPVLVWLHGGGYAMCSPETHRDMVARLALSLDNMEALLGVAGMSLANLVRPNVYATDVDLLLRRYGVLAARLGAAGVAPTATMLGVTRLAVFDLMVELEGTAVA